MLKWNHGLTQTAQIGPMFQIFVAFPVFETNELETSNLVHTLRQQVLPTEDKSLNNKFVVKQPTTSHTSLHTLWNTNVKKLATTWNRISDARSACDSYLFLLYNKVNIDNPKLTFSSIIPFDLKCRQYKLQDIRHNPSTKNSRRRNLKGRGEYPNTYKRKNSLRKHSILQWII